MHRYLGGNGQKLELPILNLIKKLIFEDTVILSPNLTLCELLYTVLPLICI